MDSEKTKTCQSYWLRPYQAEASTTLSSTTCFVLEEVSSEHRRQGFASVEQVIDFLLDELQVPKRPIRTIS